jgi:hypothetical protein
MKTLIASIAIVLFLISQLGSKEVVTSNESAIAPTNLAYFTVQPLGRDFQLTWATNSEEKESRLELQKSFNERQFETLAVFKGADRSRLKAYAYTDTMPFERTAHEVKIIYYRLKQVDANQIYTYSKVISIVREDIYESPNPTL